MSLTYAIADLHGRLDLLTAAYAKIHATDKPGTVIHLGDYIDRGPESRAIIEELMGPFWPGWRRIVLKGNHEDMMVITLRKPLNPEWWIGNGGGQTLVSYGHARKGDYNPSVVPGEHIEWLDNLPLLYTDTHRIYVHAGIDPTVPLDEQKDQVLMWWLYPDECPLGHGAQHVVHGHHQHADGPKLFSGRTNLDTFAWYTGRLIVGVFDDDLPGGPIDLIEITGKPSARMAA